MAGSRRNARGRARAAAAEGEPRGGAARSQTLSLAVQSRPRIETLLAAAWERRLTLVIAGAGYGKTTAVRGLAATGQCHWLGLRPADREIKLLVARLAQTFGLDGIPGLAVPATAIGAEDRRGLAESQAAVLCEGLERLDNEMLLVLDDVEQLAEDDSAVYLLRALCLQAPPQLHIAMSGRVLPELGLGTGSAGELLEIAAPDLAFTLDETSMLLGARLGRADDGLAEKAWSLTGGWPAALQVMVDRLERVDPGQRMPTLEQLPVLGGQFWREFVRDLLVRERPDARRALAVASVAPLVDPLLLAALGVDRPVAVLDSLHSRGLLVAADDGGSRTMSPVLSDVVVEELSTADADALREQVGSWLESAGRLDEALECRLGGAASELLAFVERRGDALVARGYGARVVEILRSVGTGGEAALDPVLGEALQSIGDWDGAIAVFRRLHRDAGDGRLAPAVAWRFGALLYLRGDSETALEVLSAAHVEGEGTSADALVSAWLSSTLWSRGVLERATRTASIALAQAEGSHDAAALAAAHVAAALAAASSGDRARNERHYRAALTAAAQAGDSIQLARIRANLSSRALEEGDYTRAIDEADRALSAGAGHKFFAALALCNKADALLHLGELDDARAALAEALEMYSTLGSLFAGAAHGLLGGARPGSARRTRRRCWRMGHEALQRERLGEGRAITGPPRLELCLGRDLRGRLTIVRGQLDPR
jgi:tetratricopeptide (TPR) repeat protein